MNFWLIYLNEAFYRERFPKHFFSVRFFRIKFIFLFYSEVKAWADTEKTDSCETLKWDRLLIISGENIKSAKNDDKSEIKKFYLYSLIYIILLPITDCHWTFFVAVKNLKVDHFDFFFDPISIRSLKRSRTI